MVPASARDVTLGEASAVALKAEGTDVRFLWWIRVGQMLTGWGCGDQACRPVRLRGQDLVTPITVLGQVPRDAQF